MKVLGYKMFLESELNLNVLDKEIAGQKRGDVLVNKLKTGQKFTLKNNKSVKIDKMKTGEDWNDPQEVVDDEITTNGEYDSVKAKKYFLKGYSNNYRQVFKDEDGEEFKLNQLKKTQEFGSSGPGRLANEFESLQCLFLAIRQLVKVKLEDSTLRDVLITNLERAKKDLFVKNPEILTVELYDKFASDKNWKITFFKIANYLFNQRLEIKFIDIEKNYKFYHTSYTGQDSPYILIRNKYKEMAKNDFKHIDFNKFCPADVYLVCNIKQNQVLKSIQSSKTIEDLIRNMNIHFDDKNLIPLSIKKVEKGSYELITNNPEGRERPDFKITSFTIGDAAQDVIKGIGSKIFTKSIWLSNKGREITDRSLNVDSSNTSKSLNVDGEVMGKTSRHGKISFNMLKKMIQDSSQNLQELESHSDLSNLDLQDLKLKVRNLKAEIIKQSEYSTFKSLLKIDPYKRGKDITNSKNKIISRIQSMQVVLAIMQAHVKDPEECDKLITKIMRYALSIETEKFVTPRYVRVI